MPPSANNAESSRDGRFVRNASPTVDPRFRHLTDPQSSHRILGNTLNKSIPGTLDLRGGSSRAERDDRGGGRWSR